MAYKRIELDKASIDNQLLICDRVAAKLGSKPRLAMVDTYGCQQNEVNLQFLYQTENSPRCLTIH